MFLYIISHNISLTYTLSHPFMKVLGHVQLVKDICYICSVYLVFFLMACKIVLLICAFLELSTWWFVWFTFCLLWWLRLRDFFLVTQCFCVEYGVGISPEKDLQSVASIFCFFNLWCRWRLGLLVFFPPNITLPCSLTLKSSKHSV